MLACSTRLELSVVFICIRQKLMNAKTWTLKSLKFSGSIKSIEVFRGDYGKQHEFRVKIRFFSDPD